MIYQTLNLLASQLWILNSHEIQLHTLMKKEQARGQFCSARFMIENSIPVKPTLNFLKKCGGDHATVYKY